MNPRKQYQAVLEALDRAPAVALLGPRQVGKTTLAQAVAAGRESLYLDLENPADRAKLEDAVGFLEAHEGRLVVIDEVHRAPGLFQTLRGLIDRGRGRGHRTGRFLLLGSASMELLQQTGESLAGRIAYIELTPFSVLEVGGNEGSGETSGVGGGAEEKVGGGAIRDKLWLRGGFPDSFLAPTEQDSLLWREDFIRTYLERDIPDLGPRIPAETLQRFWTMLAHSQGGLFNGAQLASSLAVDGRTVARYLDLMADLLLVRRLQPLHANVKKRLVKSPKVYVRDSGLLHALLGIRDGDALLGHPICGASWEGFVLQNLLTAAPARTLASFYRTAAGAEIDLVLEPPGLSEKWAIEIKRGPAPKPGKGFHNAIADIAADRAYVVHPGDTRYPLPGAVEAIPLPDLMQMLESV